MRSETVIATHGNTDFDAFAAMLAARRLYPGAVVCIAGSLNRNVREFYRLHADELDVVVEASRLELDAIRRLIVVETVHASPARRARAGRARPGRREGRLRPPRRRDARTGLPEESVVVSRGRRADDDAGRHPRRARARGHAARGDRLRARDPRGHGLAHACDDDAARRRGTRAGACGTAREQELARPLPAHAARRAGARAAGDAARLGSRRTTPAGIEVLVAAAPAPEYVEGISQPRAQARRPDRLRGARRSSSRWTGGSSPSRAAGSPELDASALAAVLGGGGHKQAASAIFRGPLDEARRLVVEQPRRRRSRAGASRAT